MSQPLLDAPVNASSNKGILVKFVDGHSGWMTFAQVLDHANSQLFLGPKTVVQTSLSPSTEDLERQLS